MNVFLKKVNFSVLWRQSQLFLLRVISLSFIYGSLTLMAHFEPYTSQINMEKPNDTHSIQKKLSRACQTSLIEICGNKIWLKSCFFEHISSIFSNNHYINPPSVIHFWKAMAMRINNPRSFN